MIMCRALSYEENTLDKSRLKKYLEEYARQHGLRNIRHFYDDGCSGTNFAGVCVGQILSHTYYTAYRSACLSVLT